MRCNRDRMQQDTRPYRFLLDGTASHEEDQEGIGGHGNGQGQQDEGNQLHGAVCSLQGGRSHYKILWYSSMRFASAAVRLSNPRVGHGSHVSVQTTDSLLISTMRPQLRICTVDQ